jgi:hypothetical protein
VRDNKMDKLERRFMDKLKVAMCPDCSTEEILSFDGYRYIDPKGDGVGYEIKVYFCQKCEGEFTKEDLI